GPSANWPRRRRWRRNAPPACPQKQTPTSPANGWPDGFLGFQKFIFARGLPLALPFVFRAAFERGGTPCVRQVRPQKSSGRVSSACWKMLVGRGGLEGPRPASAVQLPRSPTHTEQAFLTIRMILGSNRTAGWASRGPVILYPNGRASRVHGHTARSN